MSESSESSPHRLNSKRNHSPTIEETSMQTNGCGGAGTRKKYKVISEDVRKSIIQRLTGDNANIKEVSIQKYWRLVELVEISLACLLDKLLAIAAATFISFSNN